MKDKAGGGGGMFSSTRTINQQHNHFLGIPFEREREADRETECVLRGAETEWKSKRHAIHCLRDKTPPPSEATNVSSSFQCV